jgi:hypothetical protein
MAKKAKKGFWVFEWKGCWVLVFFLGGKEVLKNERAKKIRKF